MVLVFKTSVSSKTKVKIVSPILEKIQQIDKWNFDLHDCGNILRVETSEFISALVITELEKLGFQCHELE